MHVLASVFFKVQARYPDLLRTPLQRMSGFVAFGGHDLEFAVSRERLIVLRDLVTLRQVGIEIVFAREDRSVVDVQTERESRTRAKFDDATIQHRQRAGQTKTRRTGVRVWLVAETRCAAAEDLRLRAQLRMDLETDNSFLGHAIDVRPLDGCRRLYDRRLQTCL